MTEEQQVPKKKEKGPPKDLVIPPKKPKLSKAERRALQEQQRAAKAARQGGGGSGDGKQSQGQPPNAQKKREGDINDKQKQSQKQTKSSAASNSDDSHVLQKTVALFSHLPAFKKLPNPYAPEWTSHLHPAVIELGMQYASGKVRGGNSRCRAMLKTFLEVLDDYVPPTETTVDFRQHLDQLVLKASFTFWTTQCRPHSVSMGNAFTFLKTTVNSLSRETPWKEAKEILTESIEQYILEKMNYASRAIGKLAIEKIHNGDVILTFGDSEVISTILTKAKEANIKFYVWVVGARPLFEGKETLLRLRKADIDCGYVQLTGLTYVMRQVTKVFLGASALMSNGSVQGRVGTASVALLANDKRIPVLVCCETHKISNKTLLESFNQNELGDPDALIQGDALSNWKEQPNLKLLNLMYDVTPPDFVTAIITDAGIIPPTSVAVVLREMIPVESKF